MDITSESRKVAITALRLHGWEPEKAKAFLQRDADRHMAMIVEENKRTGKNRETSRNFQIVIEASNMISPAFVKLIKEEQGIK